MLSIWEKKLHLPWIFINVLGLFYVWLSYDPIFEEKLLSIVTSTDAIVFVRWLFVMSIIFQFCTLLLRNQLEKLLNVVVDDFMRMKQATTINETRTEPVVAGGVLLTIGVLLGIALVATGALDAERYLKIISEDGLVEYGSFLLWIMAAIAVAANCVSAWPRTKISVLLYTGVLLFCIVCAGEEISWGQRILGFDTPDAWAAVNKQAEINLHNVGSISVFAHIFLLIMLALFFIWPFIRRRYPLAHKLANYYDIPIVHRHAIYVFVVALLTWIIIGVRFGTLGFHPFSIWDYYTQMDDEAFEFMAAYSFFVFCVLDWISRSESRVAERLGYREA